MRIERIRTSPSREMGEIDLTLGSGLIGWSGGSARDRRLFADLLGWILGLSSPDLPGGGLPRFRVPPTDAEDSGEDVEEGPGEWSASSGAIEPAAGGPVAPTSLPVEPERGEADVLIEGELVHLRAGRGWAPGEEPGEAPAVALHERLGMDADTLSLVWGGGSWVEPEPLWSAGARIVASRWGIRRLDRAVGRLGGSGGPARGFDGTDPREGSAREDGGEPEDARAELVAVAARLEELEDVPHRLRELEEELRSLRADAAEVAGDLEVATMDWLRERQDAETHLQQYRDRARELQARIREMEEMGPEGSCPFCGRRLDDHLDRVMEELEDEWEDLVQDGGWWRRRRDQLELKPDVLQELERASVRLQAEVEECAERLERCRFELREWDELRDRREELLALLGDGGDTPREGWREGGGAARRRRATLRRAFEAARDDLLAEARSRLAREAGSLLNRISGGRILTLVDEGDGGFGLLEDGRVVRGNTVEDRAAAALALHLGLVVLLRESGVPLDSVVVGETFRGMDPEARVRAVEALRGLQERISQIVILSADDTVDAVPERFDQILEFRPDRNRPSLKGLPGGMGRLRIRRRS